MFYKKIWPRYKKSKIKDLNKNTFTSLNFVCKSLYFSKILKKKRKKPYWAFYLDQSRKNNTNTMSKGPTARKKKSLVCLSQLNQKTNIYCFNKHFGSSFLAFVSSCAPVILKQASNINYLLISLKMYLFLDYLAFFIYLNVVYTLSYFFNVFFYRFLTFFFILF